MAPIYAIICITEAVKDSCKPQVNSKDVYFAFLAACFSAKAKKESIQYSSAKEQAIYPAIWMKMSKPAVYSDNN